MISRIELFVLMTFIALLAWGCSSDTVGSFEGDEPGECSDFVDNDRDLLFDCDDPDCAGAPVCQAPQSEGDVDTADAEPSPVEDIATAPRDAGPDRPEEDVIPQREDDADETPQLQPLPRANPADPCTPMPPSEGVVIDVFPDQLGSLESALVSMQPGDILSLHDGTYTLPPNGILLNVERVTLRTASGDPLRVFLDGGFAVEDAITITAPGVTVAELTLRKVLGSGVVVSPTLGGEVLERVRIYRVRVIDALQTAVAVISAGSTYADGGEVACGDFKITDEGREALDGQCTIGGISLRSTRDWLVRDNRIEQFWCQQGLARPAVTLERGNGHTIIERNHIVDCAQGLAVGLHQTSIAGQRTHDDVTCETASHVDDFATIARNNVISAVGESISMTSSKFEAGIALWAACKAKVVHNTVFSTTAPFSSIEWRFSGTVDGSVTNNLVSHNLRERAGADAVTIANLEQADALLFVDAEQGDFHLDPQMLGAIDEGAESPEGLADTDVDGDMRLGAGTPDIGADEAL